MLAVSSASLQALCQRQDIQHHNICAPNSAHRSGLPGLCLECRAHQLCATRHQVSKPKGILRQCPYNPALPACDGSNKELQVQTWRGKRVPTLTTQVEDADAPFKLLNAGEDAFLQQACLELEPFCGTSGSHNVECIWCTEHWREDAASHSLLCSASMGTLAHWP